MLEPANDAALLRSMPHDSRSVSTTRASAPVDSGPALVRGERTPRAGSGRSEISNFRFPLLTIGSFRMSNKGNPLQHSAASHTRWSRVPAAERPQVTQAGRNAHFQKFLDQCDGDEKRAATCGGARISEHGAQVDRGPQGPSSRRPVIPMRGNMVRELVVGDGRLVNADEWGNAGPIDVMSVEQAKAITEQIRSQMGATRESVYRAWQGRVWIPLGYRSFDAYCVGEFGPNGLRLPRKERRATVTYLRRMGMSIRAITSATGEARNTVRSISEPRIHSPARPRGVNSTHLGTRSPTCTATTYRTFGVWTIGVSAASPKDGRR